MPRSERRTVRTRERAPDQAGGCDIGQTAMTRFLAKPGFLLARVDQICTALFADLAPGVTLPQAELLLLLEASGAMPQAGLSRAAGLDTSTTGYVLDNLEARGWIERRADPRDRRRSLVATSAASQAQAPAIRAAYRTLQDSVAAGLDPAELPPLIALLRSIGSNPMAPAPLWEAPAAGSPGGFLAEAPSFLFRRAMQLFFGAFVGCTASLSLTPRQFSLLFILNVQRAITQAEFARLFGLDPSTCGVIMRNLAARALIEGVAAPGDRRARLYRLTDAGRDILLAAQPMADRSERMVFRGASAAEVRLLVRQLRRLARAYSGRLRFPGPISTS